MTPLRICLLMLAASVPFARAALPHFDHVVVVIEENHAYQSILGASANAPFLKKLATEGASFSESHAVTHPSQPNYLALFSGSTQGVIDDELPANRPFDTPNLAAELLSSGYSFAAFSQALPYVGYNGKEFTSVAHQHQYERKHNPWTNWQNSTPGHNQLSPLVNLPFEHCFPTAANADFSILPTVSFVIPNEQFDMHDGSVAAGDSWLRKNLAAYTKWARSHDSLLIITWDEDEGTRENRIPTLFVGAHIKPGLYNEPVNHYRVLRTIEDIFGLPHAGKSAQETPIIDVFSKN